MANTKISQLPAKSANLATTDLVEISEVSGLTYVSKKITGQEIIGGVASGIIEDSITDGVVNKAPSENAVFDALALKVPYTGATGDVDLGEYELKAGQIELDQSPTGTAGVAVTRWNNTIGSTETTLKGGSVVLKNGVDLVARVVNNVTPNATLTKAAYQVVRVSGAQGQRLAVAYAQANNDNNSADTLGVVIETIPTNQEGFIMTVGQIEDINTSGSLQGETWADGDVLYLSPTIPGAVTKVKPTGATGHIVIIGYVEYAHAVNGKIYVKIMNGWELDELHNVYINSGTLANNDALIYESSTQLWKNKTIATALGYTPEDVANKQSNLTASATKYPTVDAVNTGLSGKANTGAITGSGLTMSTSRLLGRTTASSGAVEEITAGTGLTLSGGTLSVSGSVIQVGTSAVTSGTDGRVFFQAGGVVQQDANFTFDNTLKRLTLRAVGTAATDIPFAVQNSGGTRNNLTVNGAGLTTSNIDAPGSYVWTNHFQAVRFESGSPITNVNIKTNYPFVESFYIGRSTGTANNDASTASGIVYSHQGEFTVRNTQTGGYYGITLNANQNLTQRVGIDTGITGFGDGWSLRNFTNSVDVINFQTNSPRVGIGWNNKGAALGAILDVKAQGALSTDIAFRVRNSADTANLTNINGNGGFKIGLDNAYHISLDPTSPSLRGQNGATVAWQLSPWSGEHSWLTNNPNNQNLIGIGTTSPSDKLHIYNTANDYRIRIAVAASNPADESCGIRFTTTWAGTSFGADAANLVVRTKGTSSSTTQRTALEFRMNALGTSALRASLTSQSNFLLQSPTEDTNDIGVIYIPNGTAPTSSITDGYKQYSADITAGNAAPHFRTENGSVIKLYQNAAVTTTQGVADALTNLGVLASSTIVPTVQSVASAATVTPTFSNDLVKITAQAAALTLAAPTGTAIDGKDLMIRIKDDGTARAITWTSGTGGYRAIGVTLPTTTVAGKTTYVGLIYNSDDSRWDAIGVTTEA